MEHKMKETFYRKVGHRYKPVLEYDSHLLDAFPAGAHLVVCEPGCKSTFYNVEPDHASLLAAFRPHRDELGKVLRKASELRMQRKITTPREREAWKAWASIMGDEVMVLQSASISDLLDTLEKSLVRAASEVAPDPTERGEVPLFAEA